jgi:hypothetical protein
VDPVGLHPPLFELKKGREFRDNSLNEVLLFSKSLTIIEKVVADL